MPTRKFYSLLMAFLGWAAVVGQYILMYQHRATGPLEATIRFFSFFTILTNTLVACYFSYQGLKKSTDRKRLFDKPGTLTALTVYIFIVGLVYQLVLRSVWEPTGLQVPIDELLHTVIPLLTLWYWYKYEEDGFRSALWTKWLIYPLVYLVYILTRGHFSGFYPYPFVDVAQLGLQTVLINSFLLLLVFTAVSLLFIWVVKRKFTN